MHLSKHREITTKKLGAIELPACFALATIAAATNAHERTSKAAKASRRRLLEKAERLASVEVAS